MKDNNTYSQRKNQLDYYSQDCTSLTLLPVKECVFCDNDFQIEQYPVLQQKAMYTKYQKNHIDYQKREINKMLGENSSSALINLKDQIQFNEQQSYLTRFYDRTYYQKEFLSTLRYYKFHKDLQRIFMMPESETYFYYQACQRNIQYKLLNLIPQIQDNKQTFYKEKLLTSKVIQQSQTQTQIKQMISNIAQNKIYEIDSFTIIKSSQFNQKEQFQDFISKDLKKQLQQKINDQKKKHIEQKYITKTSIKFDLKKNSYNLYKQRLSEQITQQPSFQINKALVDNVNSKTYKQNRIDYQKKQKKDNQWQQDKCQFILKTQQLINKAVQISDIRQQKSFNRIKSLDYQHQTPNKQKTVDQQKSHKKNLNLQNQTKLKKFNSFLQSQQKYLKNTYGNSETKVKKNDKILTIQKIKSSKNDEKIQSIQNYKQKESKFETKSIIVKNQNMDELFKLIQKSQNQQQVQEQTLSSNRYSNKMQYVVTKNISNDPLRKSEQPHNKKVIQGFLNNYKEDIYYEKVNKQSVSAYKKGQPNLTKSSKIKKVTSAMTPDKQYQLLSQRKQSVYF